MSKETLEFVGEMRKMNGEGISLETISEIAMDLYRWSDCIDYYMIAEELEDEICYC